MSSSVVAQNLRNTNGPAEIPPVSYQGKQYVDSNGCAFIRAGYSGRVTWVPRVLRSRKLLCGFRPSLAAQARQQQVQEAPRKTPKVVTAKPAKISPPVKNVRTVKSVQTAPLDKINKRSVPAARVKPTNKLIAPCVGASKLSSRYINKSADVRCGPQPNGTGRTIIREEISPQSRLNRNGSTNLKVALTPTRQTQRVVRQVSSPQIRPPKGYRAVHDDGRLNPQRGLGTAEGSRQMALVWSNTVPRYLIDPLTGKPVK